MPFAEQKELLKNRQFLFLWLEQLLTQFSYNLVNFSSIVTVFKLTRSNFSVGVLLLCFFLPSSLTTMIAGYVSDHFHRKKIMATTNLIWAALVLTLVLARNYYWLFLLVTVLIQITDEFFQNANQATIPLVVEEKDLLAANSFFTLTNYLCLLVGSFSVGLLVRLASPTAPFITAALLVFLGAFFVSKLKFSQKLAKIPKNKEIISLLKEQLSTGWRFIRASRVISTLVSFIVILHALQSFVLAISPGFVENVLGIEAADASFIFVLPLGIGLLSAGYFLSKYSRKYRKITLIQRGMILIASALLFLSLIPKSTKVANLAKNVRHFESILHISLPLALTVGFLGFGGALVFVPANTLFQESLPDDLRGRVTSTLTFLTYISNASLTLPSSFLADKIGFFPLLLLLSLSGFFFGFFSRKLLIEAKILEK